jgi:hypothetical protein
MNIIRPESERKYSVGEKMQVHSNGTVNWAAGDPSDPEDLCEVTLRLLEQSSTDIQIDDDLVDAVRDRLDLPPIGATVAFPTADEVERDRGGNKPRKPGRGKDSG